MRVIPLPSIADDLDRLLLPGLSFQPPAACLASADRALLRKQDWIASRNVAGRARQVEEARRWLNGRG